MSSDDVRMPSMDAAMLTALTPSLQPTGEHKSLPDGYCPDCCGAPCLRDLLASQDEWVDGSYDNDPPP
jgi:hypothetical protein